MRRITAALIGALLISVLGAGAAGAARTKPTIAFFSGSQSDAHWWAQDSADANRMSIELEVGPTVFESFAGWFFLHEEGTPPPPPANEPGFWHKEDRAGPTGGSPRLVMLFSNGNMALRPDQWSTSWQQVGNSQDDGNWDVVGGSCGALHDATYTLALGCFGAQPVQSVFMVTDSNWLYLGGYTNWVDRIEYNGFEYSHASDNNNAQNG